MKSLSEKCLGGERSEFLSREIEENKRKIALRLYIENTKLDASRGVKSCQVLVLDRFIYQGAIESCP